VDLEQRASFATNHILPEVIDCLGVKSCRRNVGFKEAESRIGLKLSDVLEDNLKVTDVLDKVPNTPEQKAVAHENETCDSTRGPMGVRRARNTIDDGSGSVQIQVKRFTGFSQELGSLIYGGIQNFRPFVATLCQEIDGVSVAIEDINCQFPQGLAKGIPML
jgi:hypothetical protein